MMQPDIRDEYSGIAITGEQDFQLMGSGLVVPVPLHLQTRPEAAFIVMAFLERTEPFTAAQVSKSPGFKELCNVQNPSARFHTSLNYLRFFFEAVSSTFIQVDDVDRGYAHTYWRNPAYEVLDKRDSNLVQ